MPDLKLSIYNTIKRKKELFKPINPPLVGLYVCGPTVYGVTHLGHARPAITFDLLYRYLLHLGYKVRYVRNITDVGHLENDADEGEDKVSKKARLEELEPMEVVQMYANMYHDMMQSLNTLPPSIEPQASGHIIEQIAYVEKIIEAGYAYESNGSVYFDVNKYNQNHHYGKLSGRVLEEMLSTTRQLDGQQEKQHAADFAIWKKAAPEHIMRWPSPWSDGFPGWHMECSAMGKKYLGDQFDIHGGGLDLLFPHHESEIAQCVAVHNHEPAKYWMHNNMITLNGQKMGKSLGNSISLTDFFSGKHELLEQAYSPMTIRFFMLQAHYRSTLDFSNEALKASEKGFERLMKGLELLNQLTAGSNSDFDLSEWKSKCYDALNDDLNSPILIAHLFESNKWINQIHNKKASISETDLKELKDLYSTFVIDVLGLKPSANDTNNDQTDHLMKLIIELRQQARSNKDFSMSDLIRDKLNELGIRLLDSKEGTKWENN